MRNIMLAGCLAYITTNTSLYCHFYCCRSASYPWSFTSICSRKERVV